jgi:1-acyl-sn-glycerol-3-phosphate acyltransferase
MTHFSAVFEELLKSPRKTLESLWPEGERLKKIFSFDYDDTPSHKKYYDITARGLRLLHDYYFKTEHVGHVKEMKAVAGKEKVMVISNHANTLEAALICYYFHVLKLGVVRSLVFKEAFRLPLIREIFKAGQCLPVSVAAGKEALKKDHILLFPEGMDFIKHYVKKDYVVRYHRGFLRIAREYLLETGKPYLHILPTGHDGIDYTIKFWVVNHPFLVKNFIEPYLHYPYFVMPKAPVVFPTHAIFNWGRPRKVTLEELKDERSMGRLSEEFRHEIVRLRHRAHQVRQMDKTDRPPVES